MYKFTLHLIIFATSCSVLTGCDPPANNTKKQDPPMRVVDSMQIAHEQYSGAPSLNTLDVETEVDIAVLAQESAALSDNSTTLGEAMQTTSDMLAASEKMLKAFNGAYKKLFEQHEEVE